MKTIKLMMAVVLMVIATQASAQNKKEHNIDDSKIALQGYSAVSYVDLNLAQRGDKDYMTEHGGIKYFFVNADQKKSFDQNPSKYLPQYGGFVPLVLL